MIRMNSRLLQLIWVNFVVSVWLMIAVETTRFIVYLSKVSVIQNMWGPFSPRVYLAPLVLAIVNLMLWFGVYRNDRQGARTVSGFIGIFLFLSVVVVNLLNASIYDWWKVSYLYLTIYSYIIISHWVFTIFYREHSTSWFSLYHSIDDVPLEHRKMIKYIEKRGMPKPQTQFVKSNSINIDTVIDMNDQSAPSKKTTYNINDTIYNSIDDVPPEYREMIRNIKTNGTPKAQIFESKSRAIGYHKPNAFSGGEHRDKFLREAVYPNLHLMDEKAINTVMEGVQGKGKIEGNGKGIMSFLRRLRKSLKWPHD